MFKKKKASEVRKVLDAKYEVKENTEEDKRGVFAYLTDYFRQSSNMEREIMPFMGGINKIIGVIKKLPKSPHPLIPSREVWLSLWAALLGIGFTALLAYLWKFPMLF